jgi:hypothetical protein
MLGRELHEVDETWRLEQDADGDRGKLERMEYVRREPDPADRRAKLVVPTALGLQQRARIDAAMVGIQSEIAERLGTKRYRASKDAIQQVAVALCARRSQGRRRGCPHCGGRSGGFRAPGPYVISAV